MAGVLDLPQNPDFFWKHQLPGLADSHVRETVSFPDLLIRVQQVRERTKGTQELRSFFVFMYRKFSKAIFKSNDR